MMAEKMSDCSALPSCVCFVGFGDSCCLFFEVYPQIRNFRCEKVDFWLRELGKGTKNS